MRDFVLERIFPVFIGYHDTSNRQHTFSDETYGKRVVMHYELEYIVSSRNGYIVTDNIPVPVEAQNILFRYPGMEVEGIGIYHSLFVEFDLNQLAEESDTLKKIPVILKNEENRIGDRKLFEQLFLPSNASNVQLLLWRSDIMRMLSYLLREGEQKDGKKEKENMQLQKIRKALSFVQEHFSEDITVEKLAERSGYSTFHFCRSFKIVTQLTPMQYVVQYRAQKAREYLAVTDEKTEIVMEIAGFHNYGYFWKVFKTLYGVSPREYRTLLSNEKRNNDM